MTLVKWNPWRSGPTGLLERTVFSGLFDDFFPETRTTWLPAVDVAETEEAYEYRAELPGLEKKDVKVTVKDNVLTIEGEKKVDKKDKKRDNYHSERQVGSFIREFILPKYVQTDKLKAEYAAGVLTITIPKAEEAKPKEIAIQ